MTTTTAMTNHTAPVNANDKRLILAKTDVLQLFPLKYQWAWDHYLESNQNHWTPLDIAMAPDIADWADKDLSEAYRHRFKVVFAQLTTFDMQRGIDLAESLIPLMDAPEIKQFLMRQTYEESLHTWSYQYCIENMNLDSSEIYNMYRVVPQLYDRVQYAKKYTDLVGALTPSKLENRAAKIELLVALCFWFLAFEGVWFALNLAGPVQSMARQRRFTATAEQFQYILRDENVHINFGIDLINTFINEYPQTWVIPTVERIKQMMYTVADLELKFISYACKHPSHDYNVDNHMDMVYWYINRRCHSIGIQEEIFPNVKCSMPWMSEMIELKKEKNFFETRVTEYRKASLNYDDISGGLDIETLTQ